MKLSKKVISVVIGSMIGLNAHAADLFVTVNSNNPVIQGAAMVLSTQVLEQKNKVRVLLCGDGGDVALKTKDQTKLKPKNLSAQQMMQGLMKSGVTVEVCALYLPNSGRQASELVDGVKVANPGEIAKHMTSPEVRILSF
jgi:predicted peroxiredoxin